MTSVIEEGINRLLQHALFVSDNDFRSLQLHQVAETIVPVNDTAIEIVQVGSRKAATFQRNQRTKIGRNDRKNRHDHPLGTRIRVEESAGELEALGQLLAVLLRTSRFHGLFKLNDKLFKVGLAQEITNRLGTHSGAEGFVTVIFLGVTEFIFSEELASLKRSLTGLGHKVVLIVNNTLKLTRGHVEDKTDTGRHTLVEPNVGDRNSKVNVAHALTTNPREGHLNTTTVTDGALVFDALVFSAGTFPVAGWSEDPLAEEPAFFRLECPVVDGFRIENLAIGPRPNGLGIGDGNGNLVEGIRLGIHSV